VMGGAVERLDEQSPPHRAVCRLVPLFAQQPLSERGQGALVHGVGPEHDLLGRQARDVLGCHRPRCKNGGGQQERQVAAVKHLYSPRSYTTFPFTTVARTTAWSIWSGRTVVRSRSSRTMSAW